MKKIIIAALVLLPFSILAQEKEEVIEKKEKAEKAEKPEKTEKQEIIIRQNGGDKDIKLEVEINGDNVKINGKPLSEFEDKDITINKRKITIGKGKDAMVWNFNSDGGDWQKWGEEFGRNFQQQFGGGSWDEDGSDKAFLGVTTETGKDGATIQEVVKGSAAEKAGLQKGDIITKAGDEKITSPESLSDVIGFKKPDDEIKIAYKRDGKSKTVNVKLGKKKRTAFAFSGPKVRSFTIPPIPEPPLTNMEGFNYDELGQLHNDMARIHADAAFPRQKKIGLKIQDIEEGNGVKVINVEDSSAAATAGIKKDDIITEIDGKKVENTDDAREQLAPDEDKKLYKVKVNRGGTELSFDIKIPKKLKTANL